MNRAVRAGTMETGLCRRGRHARPGGQPGVCRRVRTGRRRVGELAHRQSAAGRTRAPRSCRPGMASCYSTGIKFHASFAVDLPARQAAFMADSQVRWGVGALSGSVSQPAWRVKPSWYLVTTRDQMIPPQAQRAMWVSRRRSPGRRRCARSRRPDRSRRTWPSVSRATASCSHSPRPVSRPDDGRSVRRTPPARRQRRMSGPWEL